MKQVRNKKIKYAVIICVSILVLIAAIYLFSSISHLIAENSVPVKIKLPAPMLQSATSVEAAIKQRRSIREYKNEPMTLQQVAQLLWAAQGISAVSGFRTAPSAGALYPLEIYLIVGNVQDLPVGVYHYLPADHSIEKILEGDKRGELFIAAQAEPSVKAAAIDIVITGNDEKTAKKYNNRAERFVAMEAGHAAQNLYLQSISLGLGMVTIGVFNDAEVRKVLLLPALENPLYLIPVGKIN